MASTTTPDPAATTPATSTPTPEPAAAAATAVSTPKVTPDKAAGSLSSPGTAESVEDILGADELAKVKDDPAAYHQAINKAWTQKTQALAESRKRQDAWQHVISALEENPQAAVKALAQHVGISIAPEAPAAPSQPAKSATEQAVAQINAVLDEVGLGGLGDKLAPAIRAIAADAVGEQIKPIEQGTTRLLTEQAQRELGRVMQAFEAKHPDWKQHEQRMMQLAQQYPPARGQDGRPLVSEDEYLESLYYLANRDGMIRKGVEAEVERMRNAATESTDAPGSVPQTRVQHTAPRGAGFRAAYEAAKRGEIWDR